MIPDWNKRHPPRFRPRHRGAVQAAWLGFLGSLVLMIVLVLLLVGNPLQWLSDAPAPKPLVVYCAAGLRTPVEAIAKTYEDAYGVPIQLHYGGSQTLLAGLEVTGQGDLYIPADDSYLKISHDKNLTAETFPLLRMTPVAAVAKGNPKRIRTFDDLLRPDVRLGQANPDAAAIGSVTRLALQKSGQWEALKDRTRVFKMTVNDVANDVLVGAVDAGIVWDAIVRQNPGLEAVTLPAFEGVKAHVSIAILKSSHQPAAAARFARFLAARDGGLPVFASSGYETVKGDAWREDHEAQPPTNPPPPRPDGNAEK